MKELKIKVLVDQRPAAIGGGYIGIVIDDTTVIDEWFVSREGLLPGQSFTDIRGYTLEVATVSEWQKTDADTLWGVGGGHSDTLVITNMADIPDFMGIRTGVKPGLPISVNNYLGVLA